MYRRDTIMLSPIVGHLVCELAIPSQLVKEELRVKVPSVSVLVDLRNVQRALRTVRVPDLEVDGVNSAFTVLSRNGQFEGGGVVGPRW